MSILAQGGMDSRHGVEACRGGKACGVQSVGRTGEST